MAQSKEISQRIAAAHYRPAGKRQLQGTRISPFRLPGPSIRGVAWMQAGP
jgi:hypothetical protein